MKNIDNIAICGKLPFVLLLKDSINDAVAMNEGIEISIDSLSGIFFHKRIVAESQKGAFSASEDFLGAFTYAEFEMRITKISSE